MPKSDESGFLDSIFPVVSPADEGEPPGEEEIEKPDPREAYLPDVVGPRIRNALRGGQGISGNPRRYGMIVALLVGLASLPSWIVLRSGVDEIMPGDRMTGGAVLVQPLPELPLIVAPPRTRTRNTTQVAAEPLVRPTRRAPGRVSHPQRPAVIPEHRSGNVDPRPIAKHPWSKHKGKNPKGKHHRAKWGPIRQPAHPRVVIRPIRVPVVARTVRVPMSRQFRRPVGLPHRTPRRPALRQFHMPHLNRMIIPARPKCPPRR